MKSVEGLGWAFLAILVAVMPPGEAQSASVPDVGVQAPDGGVSSLSTSGLPLNLSAGADAGTNMSMSLDAGGGGGPSTPAGRGQVMPVSQMPRMEDPGFTLSAAVGTAVGLGLLAYFWQSIKYGLAVGFAMPLFSRISHNRILDNGVRNRVHEAVCQNAGITIKEVKDLLGIGWGTTVYHLKRLEDERLIVSERHRQFRRFYQNGGKVVNQDKTAFSELKNPTAQRLANQLIITPGAAQKDLCQALGISAPLASKHLSRLEAANLLTRQRDWKTVKYFPTDRLAQMVASPALLVAV